MRGMALQSARLRVRCVARLGSLGMVPRQQDSVTEDARLVLKRGRPARQRAGAVSGAV